MRLSNQIILASQNRHKLEEFCSISAPYSFIEIVPIENFVRNPNSLGNVEKYSTYLENAIAKARVANQASHYPSLADDSGLEVECLEGKPGIRSHRYAPIQPNKTQDQANVEFLLKEIHSSGNRSAKFVCSLALLIEGILIHATETLEGTLTMRPQGEQGFGYDSIFIPNGKKITLAEMSLSEKNEISHRAQAFHQLMNQINSRGIVFAKP